MSCSDELDLDRLVDDTSVSFHRRLVELAPGAELDEPETPWDDAIVFVTAGVVELECARGERHSFHRGDILSFARLPLRSVRNSGTAPAQLLAIWRRTSAPVD